MAIFHHRKLSHYLTSTKTHHSSLSSSPASSPSSSSSFSPCYDFCDPSCSNFSGNDCYYFSGDPPPLSASATVAYQLSPIVIVIIVVLVSVFLLVSCSAFILKCFTSWTRFLPRRNNPDPSTPAPGQGHHESSDSLFDDRDQAVDHPIWLISTVGLNQSIINSITVVKYKKEDGLIEGIDCSVCLGEFEEGETLRLLPKCNHAFHIDCIDPWLRSHTNCPLCRAGIVVTPGPSRPGLDPSESSSGHSRQMNDSESSEVEMGGIQIGDSSENRGNVGYNEDEIVNNLSSVNGMDGPLVLGRRSSSVQLCRGSNLNSFRLFSSSSPRTVGPSLGSRLSPITGPMKRSYSWSERVIGSTDNPRCNSRFSP